MASEDGITFKEEGNKLMTKKDWDGAINCYTKAIECDPKNHIFYSNRCAAFIRKGEKEKALTDAEKCVELAPEWPKSYVRLAHALKGLGRYDGVAEACSKGLVHDKDNIGLQTQLMDAKNHLFFAQIEGKWHGSVPMELGGYNQELNFVSIDKVFVKVFDKEVETKMRIDASRDPIHMDLFVPNGGVDHEIFYIAKLEGDVLHMCSPSFTSPEARPTAFEGPAHVTLSRGAEPVIVDDETKAKVEKMSVNEKVNHYIEEALEIFPGKRLLPMQTDTEAQQNEITLLNIRFQSDNYKITAKYGADVETIVREYVLGEKQPQAEETIKLIKELKVKMQEACLLPPDDQMESFMKQQKEMKNESNTKASSEIKEPEAKVVNKVVEPEVTKKVPAKASRSDPFPMLAGIAIVVGGLAIAAIVLSRK
mmetsp:Transcript_615/g.628  ORF Transcript_615/g.628 Transcript_615/m.628 type:complete len:422 (+) Transcript_615:281-1546(+)